MCCKGHSSVSCFSPHKQKCCHPQLQSSWEPGKGASWAAEDCKTLCWNWSRCRDTSPPPNPEDHKHPGHPFQRGIFISSVLGCGCWYWLYFRCRDGCVGIAQLRITMVLPALRSRQRWGTAALETSLLSRLPVKAECLEGRMVLQLRHWAGRTELQLWFLPAFSHVILKIT